jgi:hypothetical protein
MKALTFSGFEQLEKDVRIMLTNKHTRNNYMNTPYHKQFKHPLKLVMYLVGLDVLLAVLLFLHKKRMIEDTSLDRDSVNTIVEFLSENRYDFVQTQLDGYDEYELRKQPKTFSNNLISP